MSPLECHLLPAETVSYPICFNQETQNLTLPSFSPLTTKQSDRYMLTVENIIDLFIVWNTVAT
jgi:hypothetical protein